MAGLQPFLEEALTVGTVAVQIPVASLVLGAVEVEMHVENGAIRMRLDSTNPTSTVGVLRERGYIRNLNRWEAAQARFIRDTTSTEDVTLRLTYKRQA
jgi:hypothetical protein